MYNPSRLSRDPADTMGDDEHRPGAPTEPPDLPKGMRRQWGEVRAKTGVSEASGVMRGSAKCTGDGSTETHRPAKPGDSDDEVEGARGARRPRR